MDVKQQQVVTRLLPPGAVLTLEKIEHGWKVTAGNRWEDCLGSDEALFVVAEFIMGLPQRYLKTTAEHEAFEKKLKELRENRDGRPEPESTEPDRTGSEESS